MSAPKDARPLGMRGWRNEDGSPMSEEQVRTDPAFKVACQCGWKGNFADLLGVDEEETLWCPQCRTIAWEYA